MQRILAWVKQPTTLMAIAIALAAAVYWFTGNADFAGMAAVAVLGGVNDRTHDLLVKIEALEDASRPHEPPPDPLAAIVAPIMSPDDRPAPHA